MRTAHLNRHLIGMLALMISLVTAGCSWSFTQRNNDTVPLRMADFYKVGRTWIYIETTTHPSDDATYAKTVVGEVPFDGRTAWLIVTSSPQRTYGTREYLTFDTVGGLFLGTDVIDTANGTLEHYSFLPGVRFPGVLAPGAPFISSYVTVENGENILWTVETQILDTQYEKIQVPAGVFRQALRVRTRVATTRHAPSPPYLQTTVIEEDTWYAPEIGAVKSRTTDGSHTMELIDYVL